MSTRSAKNSSPEDDLLDALVQVSFEVMATLNQVASANDLSLTQLRVLAILRDHQPTMSQLASHLGLDRSTVSGLIDRAEARGLVGRVADERDRRSSRVTLTSAGHKLARAGEAEIARRAAPMFHNLTRADQAAAARLMFRMLPDAEPE